MSYGFGPTSGGGSGTSLSDYIDIPFDERSDFWTIVMFITKNNQFDPTDFARLLDNRAGAKITIALFDGSAGSSAADVAVNIGFSTTSGYWEDTSHMALSSWTMLAVAYAGSGDPTRYKGLAGTTEATPSVVDRVTAPVGTRLLTPGALRLGNRGMAPLDRCHKGYIAELSIWDTILSGTQLMNICAGRSPMDPAYCPQANLRYYLPMARDLEALVGPSGAAASGAVLTPGEHPIIDTPPSAGGDSALAGKAYYYGD